MPIVKSIRRPLGPVGTLPRPGIPLDPTLLETFAAGFRQENVSVSFFSALPDAGDPLNIDPDFDPLGNIEGFEEFAGAFTFANTRADQLAIMARIEREIKDDRILEASGGALEFIARFAGGTLDPIILFPPLKAFTLARRLGAVKAGLRTAGAGFVGVTAAEAGLQATQETRAPLESAFNIAGGTILSGVFGAGVAKVLARARGGKVSPREAFDDAAGAVERDLNPPEGVPDIRDEGSLEISEADLRADTGPEPKAGTDTDVTTITVDRPGFKSETRIEITPGRGAGEATRQEAVPGVSEVIPDTPAELPDLDIPEPRAAGGSVGAASAFPNKTEETMKSAFGVEKFTAFITPGMRTISSPFLATRRASQELAQNAVRFEKNSLDIPSPVAVETIVKAYDFKMGTTIEAFDRLYTKYRTGFAEGGRVARLKVQAGDLARGGRKALSFKEFRIEVGRAGARDDLHEIAEVQEMAKIMRRDGLDPLKDRAVEVGALPEGLDVKTAPSYLPRMWNTEMIVARRTEYVDITTKWLKFRRDTVDIPALREAETQAAFILQDGTRAPKLLDKRGNVRNFIKVRADRDDLELRAIAEDITNRIISTPAGRLPYDAHLGRNPNAPRGVPDKKRGPLARRVHLIPDELVEDFLERDADIILRAYTRTLAPDVEIIARFGDVDMTQQFKNIQDEMADAVRLVDSDPKFTTERAREKARTRLNKRKNQDIEDLQTMMDRLKGIEGRPDNPHGIGVRALRAAREVNLLSKLGGVVVSSLPDVFRPVMVEGVTRVMRHTVVPLITNLKGLRMARAEAAQLAAVMEMTLGTRVAAIADIGDDFGRFTVGERVLGAATDTFGLVTGIGPWNQFWKETAGTVTMGRILTESRKWRAGTIKPKDRERLLEAGIDGPLAKRIADQFDIHGETQGGVMNAVTGAWDAKASAAVDAFRFAMIREVDNAIVTPGIGDRPTWTTSTQAGKNISQFKSFMFASHQSVLIAGLQRRDAATLNGLLLSVAAGVMVYYFKQLASGRPLSDDPAVWLTEGIDRSGVVAIPFEFTNMFEKIGVNVLPGGPTRSRFASRNIVGALLGPTAGLSADVAGILGSAISGDIRGSDTRALRRMLPYQNLFYIRSLLNRAEKGVNEVFGIPETRRRKTETRSFRP